mmetsp:Transcript_11043/g.27893  ORF Transcript_11043/g.27893 Transcript_11043/m.27893 type:complete len:315 (-) Transcript_11043:1097-2041(-)
MGRQHVRQPGIHPGLVRVFHPVRRVLAHANLQVFRHRPPTHVPDQVVKPRPFLLLCEGPGRHNPTQASGENRKYSRGNHGVQGAHQLLGGVHRSDGRPQGGHGTQREVHACDVPVPERGFQVAGAEMRVDPPARLQDGPLPTDVQHPRLPGAPHQANPVPKAGQPMPKHHKQEQHQLEQRHGLQHQPRVQGIQQLGQQPRATGHLHQANQLDHSPCAEQLRRVARSGEDGRIGKRHQHIRHETRRQVDLRDSHVVSDQLPAVRLRHSGQEVQHDIHQEEPGDDNIDGSKNGIIFQIHFETQIKWHDDTEISHEE